MLLLLAATLAGIGLLMMFSGVFDTFVELDTNLITPLTDNTTAYISKEGAVQNYNAFDRIIVHNLPYLFYGGAAVCIIIGLGKMGGSGGD
jgi:hypothetical protein